MKYCQNCGKQLNENAKYCLHCGKETAQCDPSPTQTIGGKTLHCPECGSTHFSPVVETTAEGGQAYHSPRTRYGGMTVYTANSTHRNYWLCQKCGAKFRNLQNLLDELAREKRSEKVSFIFGVVMAAISLMLYILASMDPVSLMLLSPLAVVVTLFAVVLLVLWLISKSHVKKLSAERDYLKTHCFR